MAVELKSPPRRRALRRLKALFREARLLERRRRLRYAFVAALVCAGAAIGLAFAAIGSSSLATTDRSAGLTAWSAARLRAGYVWDMSWISARRGWALVALPCGQVLCAAVTRTVDGGRHWEQLAVVPARLADVGCTQLPCVNQLRFANATVGYLFGPSYFVTDDGGVTWQRVASPPVESLEPGAGGLVVRVVYDHDGCPGPCHRSVQAAVAGSNDWRTLLAGMPVLDASRAVAARAISSGRRALFVAIYGDLAAGAGAQQTTIYRSLDAGRTWDHLDDPCGGGGVQARDAIDVAATAGGFLAALCSPRNAQSGAFTITTSRDDGRTWSARHALPAYTQYYPTAIAAASPRQLVVANSRVEGNGPYTYRLLYTADGGGHWTSVVSERRPQVPPIAPNFASLAFVNPGVGHWVADPHAIWTTTDSGGHWTRRPFP
jgi:photosystem II stability/assembly factor-like uncharacterized protein